MDLLGLLLKIFLPSSLLLFECRKLDAYTFPVYTTEFCPRNETEWNNRSSEYNCAGESAYACFPNKELTQLLEFCYPLSVIAIPKGLCLFLSKRSELESYNCRLFEYGCPDIPYYASTIYKYSSCVSIENGCFLAEPDCKSVTASVTKEITTTQTIHEENQGILQNIWIPIVCFASIIVVCVCWCLWKYCRKKGLRKRSITYTEDQKSHLSCDESSLLKDRDIEMENLESEKLHTLPEMRKKQMDKEDLNESEHASFVTVREIKDDDSKEEYETNFLTHWQKEDNLFIPTTASMAVERMIKTQNLVIVAGHPGSGKSSIVHHIALQYRKKGWVVNPVDTVEKIKKIFALTENISNRTLFVFDDQLGKESVNYFLSLLWRQNEESLKRFRKKVKLLVTLRKNILLDIRVQQTELMRDKSKVIKIDEEENILSDDEKMKILLKHNPTYKFTDTDLREVLKVDRYFPLLCELLAHIENKVTDLVTFLREPKEVYQRELKLEKCSYKEQYCGLLCLVLFNNKLSSHAMMTKEELFKQCLNLCDLPNVTSPETIMSSLELLQGFLVLKVGDSYQFCDDFVKEVTTIHFANDYPAQMIMYADIGFVLRRVGLEQCTESTDSFALNLSGDYISELVDRLLLEMFRGRFMEVLLNPCLRNKTIIEAFIRKIEHDQQTLHLLVRKRRETRIKQESECADKEKWSFRIKFVQMEKETSPLFALIALCHHDISLRCLKAVNLEKLLSLDDKLFLAVCCNGAEDLFDVFSKQVKMSLTWGSLNPVDILSLFHNHECLEKILKQHQDTDSLKDKDEKEVFILAIGGGDKTENYDDHPQSRRYRTIQVLLENGYGVNGFSKDGLVPLRIACKCGYYNTIQLLLHYGAEVNLCNNDKVSPLYEASKNGYDQIVQLLLHNGADVNLCNNDGVSPLYEASENGHGQIVQLLLHNGADVDLCKNDGVSPLYEASKNGHGQIVQLLLDRGAEVNKCNNDGVSPLYEASENGHDHIVELLLDSGAEINKCNNDGVSPLYEASKNGHVKTALNLLNKGAEANLCNNDGVSPLHEASKNGHDQIVRLLLNRGANKDLCNNEGVSPLDEASTNGYDQIVQLLLKHKADENACNNEGVSPLDETIQIGYDPFF